jgi:hypothetical protein
MLGSNPGTLQQVPTKHWQRRNIGANKNVRVDRIHWRWQNIGVDKILALTKFWHQQNVGADAEGSPYYLARQSPQLLTSPRPCWRSPTSPWWCWSLCMQSPSEALLLAALLLWADYLPYCTGLLYRPAMLKMSQILALTKYWCPPKIHWFSPNYSSFYICS